jgi:hypothetical protein
MEKKGYRDTLDILRDMFPGKLAISVKEAATVLGANTCTVYDAIKRKYNPLPSKKASGKILIPLPAFASWLC